MESETIQIYLDELKQIPPCTREEERELLKGMRAGDAGKKKRLIEGNLHRAFEYAGEYSGQGVSAADLVQEAGMALTIAVDSYTEGEFSEYLETEIKGALRAAVDRQREAAKIGQAMLKRVEALRETTQNMAQELGREATVEELSFRMGMTADEIRDIMKLTLDAMSINGM